MPHAAARPAPSPRWRTVTRSTVADLPGIRVARDLARLGTGPLHERPVVDFGVDACVAAARTPDKKWVLVGRWGYATRTFSWEFPGGPMLRGERPEGAAGFELARTAGMRARAWHQLPSHEPLRDALDLSCLVMVADDAQPNADAGREDPFVPVRLTTDAEMDRPVRDGLVRDAATLAAWAQLRALA